MYKITFECETITPMFLAGVDGKTPELRPPSIKGAMRFWWRATNAHLQLHELKNREAAIFGGSGENEGRSKFNLKVSVNNYKLEASLRNKIWDSKNNSIRKEYQGMAYLLYSTFMQKDNQRPYFSKIFFSIEISSYQKEVLVEAANSFYILSIFGALGSRSRRGGGNFIITKILDDNKIVPSLKLLIDIENNMELVEFIKTVVSQITIKNSNNLKNNTYSNLSSFKVFISDPETSAEECLQIMGNQYKEFRSRREPDYSNIKNYLISGNNFDTIEKAAFGLPINYRYRSLNNKSVTIEGHMKKERERCASPLIFKVLAVKNNTINYYPMIVFFERELLPKGDKIIIKDTSNNNKRPIWVNVPSNEIIHSFLSEFPNIIEVKI
ncbi:MAG: type III-B CRISPR module RAMP protein Cmr1 [Ignavibacteria bacterium]|nr:type III-B CRISPR module RAMP protein Cmr1 [Ignavibacteria bacterium]